VWDFPKVQTLSLLFAGIVLEEGRLKTFEPVY
jgi:hypothetical protein